MPAMPIPPAKLVSRIGRAPVALETTLLIHGVPRESAASLAAELGTIIQQRGALPALVGVVGGIATVGITDSELGELLAADHIPKVNTANLGLALSQGVHAATTVSTTMEVAAAAGVRVFATGGLGGVHRGYGEHLDISADLAAFTRFPVAVVASGVKSILDVEATREVLESLGIPVVGYKTDRFPAFYLRESAAGVDARFEDVSSLASFVLAELARTSRGVLVCNPIPQEAELSREDWDRWLTDATRAAHDAGVKGRDMTPFLLAQLHTLSKGETLRANIELVKSNTALAAELAAAMG